MNVFNHVAGGVLMGLANLVPGISGGTMLLATGVYRSLIEAVGQLCRLNITRRSLAPVVWIAIPAAVTIVSLAGAVSGLVQNHRPLAYATFIGLTLGGVPLLLRQLPKWTPGAKGGVVLGVMAMGGLAILESVGGFATTSGWVMAALAGMLGGASMILPGLSGGFVLLLLGQYVVILSAIDTFKDGIKLGSIEALMPPFQTLFPFGVGFALGIALTAFAMRTLLRHHESATTGVLLGLLLGAVLGLWPFRVGVQPEIGDVIRGQAIVTAEERDQGEPQHWRTETFTPDMPEVISATMAVALGFGTALAVGLLGRQGKHPRQDS
ncbi:MAG TPA: hypothetical protein DEQ73_03845 [Phycisphaerales bacterium]|nr:hypothetical protein [Phycisphaerales bacterium]